MRIECQESIQAIRQYLQNDVAYPFLIAANMASDVSAISASMPDSVYPIRVSDFCSEDGLPDEDALYNGLANAETPLLVKGLGDVMMLTGNVDFLRRIAGQTFSQKIVVLCRDQGVQLEQLQRQDAKFGENRWCELTHATDVSIICVNPAVSINKIKGFKALLKTLEDGYAGKLYVSTEIPLLCSKILANAYDAIRETTPSFVVPQQALSDEQWAEYLRNPYLTIDDPMHWRFYLNSMIQGASSPYFKLVLQYAPDYSSYRREVLNALLHVPYTANNFHMLYQERKMFLRQHQDIDVSEYVRDSLEKDADRIYYLTDNTFIEKHAIIEEIARRGLSTDVIIEIYPDLAAYFTTYRFSCPEHELYTKYFTEYKQQKVKNSLNAEFLDRVVAISLPGERKYNSLPTRNMLILQMKDEDSGLYWIDALGVEYLGYIKYLAKELGLWIDIRVGRSSLPTLTEFNRDFFETWAGFKYPKEPRIDDKKHEGVGARSSTDPAIHLAEELAIIRDSLATIKAGLTEHKAENFLLASDHGASRLCVLHQHENRWQIVDWRMEEDGKHSGRCCAVSDADQCPDSATEAEGLWVLANYDRFKGGRRTNVEVHGGASLEEVLVPVIKISLANENIICHIYGSDEDVPTIIKPLDGPTMMQLFCSKSSARIFVTIKGKNYVGVQSPTNPSLFNVDLSTQREIWHPSSAYEATVFDGDNELVTLHFRILRDRRATRNDRDGHDFFAN